MTKFSPSERMVVRYLRSLGLHQKEIAEQTNTSRQVVAYQLKNMRSKSLNKGELSTLKQAGGISPLVGYVSAPCLPSLECFWCRGGPERGQPDHSCPVYAQQAAYAQLEDLEKHQKIAVLLSLLQGVEEE